MDFFFLCLEGIIIWSHEFLKNKNKKQASFSEGAHQCTMREAGDGWKRGATENAPDAAQSTGAPHTAHVLSNRSPPGTYFDAWNAADIY